MIPVVTPEEMRAIDQSAPEPVDVLIGRAGAAVARTAVDLLGGTYGRWVTVLAGKGNNGNDGWEAARRLRRRGVRVEIVDITAGVPERVDRSDLIIDAAFGTGFRGSYDAPVVPLGVPVLAVDIPSGINGLTGEIGGRVLRADRTVTFAAGKPGLYLGAGPAHCGRIDVIDIGLDVTGARIHVVTPADARAWIPDRVTDTHKWKSAVWVVAGSPGMAGAATLVCRGAQRIGAGYVRLSTPGGLGAALPAVPVEVVHVDVPERGWSSGIEDEELGRFGALVVGNGLGRDPGTAADIRRVVAAATARSMPTVVDADGLSALAEEAGAFVGPDTVLTPHDGEYARLMGAAPAADRVAATRVLAERSGAVALLKGSTTVVAHPDKRVLLSVSGDARLASAGTGDVLAGIIAGLCAQGVEPFRAAAAGACLHGAAAALGWRHGLVAGDIAALLPGLLDGI